MKKAIKQSPFLFFLIFTFALSFITGFPTVLAPGKFGGLAYLSGFGPALGAFIVVGVAEDSDGVKSLVRSLFQWKVSFVWYLVALLGPALTMVTAVLFHSAFARNGSTQNFTNWLSVLPQHLLVIVSLFLFVMVGIWGEEVGWRGFALPKLQKIYHPLLASLTLGAIWVVWHLPAFYIEGSPQAQMGMTYFFLATLGYSILYTWVYKGKPVHDLAAPFGEQRNSHLYDVVFRTAHQ
jgi:membrane protease YdiL (CAAX protease family)